MLLEILSCFCIEDVNKKTEVLCFRCLMITILFLNEDIVLIRDILFKKGRSVLQKKIIYFLKIVVIFNDGLS